VRAPSGGSWSLAAALALVACGNLTSSPDAAPRANDGGETADPPTAGKASASGGSPSAGGTSSNATGGVTLVIGGKPNETPNHPDLGGESGQPDYPAEVMLCIYDEDIPANWGAGGAVDVGIGQCALGVLGSFDFMGCQYELLDVTPGDVDPFAGGHSHCCYKSRLIVCK
jgi:hypothetical protein